MVNAYPTPRRVNFTPSLWEPDDNGVQDMGYRIGKMSDGRPYRLEVWKMDDMQMVTIMFSDLALSTWIRNDMAWLLEDENIIAFTGEKHNVQATRTQDDAGNNIWAINLMLSDNKGTYAKVVGELLRYR